MAEQQLKHHTVALDSGAEVVCREPSYDDLERARRFAKLKNYPEDETLAMQCLVAVQTAKGVQQIAELKLGGNLVKAGEAIFRVRDHQHYRMFFTNLYQVTDQDVEEIRYYLRDLLKGQAPEPITKATIAFSGKGVVFREPKVGELKEARKQAARFDTTPDELLALWCLESVTRHAEGEEGEETIFAKDVVADATKEPMAIARALLTLKELDWYRILFLGTYMLDQDAVAKIRDQAREALEGKVSLPAEMVVGIDPQ